ncbi:hypothetical protein CY34DRAFT_101246 [Suillus luteus UH-Slu-Lm8-n1]|uniref:Uncharacterized protein n=1 Tax=Suillus luteus UH-Slu-Lm8-n1 TaxID=930992 RepID=A0A0D0AKY7_9AGAM|nr:hypothetical protein CY34DRAFT_101246 [Suillus luteus UH-Slu-Lm8-n1]
MQELSTLLGQRGIDFDPVEHRIPCFLHVINICVKHIINKYPTANYSTVSDTWTIKDQVIEKVDYVQAVQTKPLERARTIVRLTRASNQRRDRFRDCILKGNEDGWFRDDKGDSIQLPVVELLLDEPTRWDSVYIMINRLRTLQQAVNAFFDAWPQRSISNKRLSDVDWQFLQDLEVILEVSTDVFKARDLI